MSDCKRKGALIRGCKFEPRFDLAECIPNFDYTGMQLRNLIETMRAKTYRGDVCIRCGKVVNDPFNHPGAK